MKTHLEATWYMNKNQSRHKLRNPQIWKTSGKWWGWWTRILQPWLEAEVKASLSSSSLPPPTPTQSWRAGSSSTENISSPALPKGSAETWSREDKVEHFENKLFSPFYHWPLLFLWLSPSHPRFPRGMRRHLINLIKMRYWWNLLFLGQFWVGFGNFKKFSFHRQCSSRWTSEQFQASSGKEKFTIVVNVHFFHMSLMW